METGLGLVKAIAGTALNFIYPPVCVACGAAIVVSDTLCAACFQRLHAISAPFCPILGIPFATDPGPGTVSLEALAETRPYERARAAVVYSDVAQRIISRLKYADRPELARFVAQQMLRAGAEYWDQNPVLLPVPLHWQRRLMRRYNQAEEIGRRLSQLSGAEMIPGLLRRKAPGRRQVGLSEIGRAHV